MEQLIKNESSLNSDNSRNDSKEKKNTMIYLAAVKFTVAMLAFG